jgi:3-hydroxyacyl-[acyl-carrier-protein] dehydratase
MTDPLATALSRLPHGPDFRFVDRIINLNPGQSAVGEYTVRGDEPFLRGHFPGQPLFPGVLLAEAAAQLAGAMAQSDPNIPPLQNLRLTALRAVKILGTTRPGETMRIEATLAGRMGGLIQAQVKVFAGNTLILSGELTLSGEPQRSPKP